MYEPKNRIAKELPVLELWVDAADGSHLTCPNGLIGCAVWAMRGEKPDFGMGGLQPRSELFNILELNPKPGVASIVSGGPGVLFRAEDYEIGLTPEELFRFAKHDLEPREYFAIRDRFGMLHDIHEDFYDPDTGEAFQPVGR